MMPSELPEDPKEEVTTQGIPHTRDSVAIAINCHIAKETTDRRIIIQEITDTHTQRGFAQADEHRRVVNGHVDLRLSTGVHSARTL